MKLLNDRTIITSKQGSLFENLNVNSSDVTFYENKFIIDAIISLLLFSKGYNNYSQAISDNFEKFGKEKSLINSMVDKQKQYYSMLYQKEYGMLPKCADFLAKYNFSAKPISRVQNEEALKSFEESIASGCIYIGILSHYVDLNIEEGKFTSNQIESRQKAIDIYTVYFDKTLDKDMNKSGTLSFFQKISNIASIDENYDVEFDVNKKISQLILNNKITLEDKPQWIRMGYLKVLSKTVQLRKKNKFKNDNEIIENLKTVIDKKGNIFILQNEKLFSELTIEERQFLQLLQ